MNIEENLQEVLNSNFVQPCRAVFPRDAVSDRALFECALLYCAGREMAKIVRDHGDVERWTATEEIVTEPTPREPEWLRHYLQGVDLVLHSDVAQSLQIIVRYLKTRGRLKFHDLAGLKLSYVCPVLLRLAGQGDAGLIIECDSHRWIPSPNLLLHYEGQEAAPIEPSAEGVDHDRPHTCSNAAISRLRVAGPLKTIVGDWCKFRQENGSSLPIEIEAAEFLIMSEPEGVVQARRNSHGKLMWAASKRTVRLLKKNVT